MQTIEFVGLLAGALVTFSMIPQLVRVFKLKSAREISLTFTLMLLSGLILWLIYGVFLNLLPLILWNAIAIGTVSLLVYAKFKYGK